MKKIILLSVVAVLVLSMGMVAFADNGTQVPQWYNEMLEWQKNQAKNVEIPAWYKEMLKWEKGQIDEAVKNGLVTEEYAKYWKEQMDLNQKYQNQGMFGFGHHGMMGMGRGMMGRLGGLGNSITNGFNGLRGFGMMGGRGGFGMGGCRGW